MYETADTLVDDNLSGSSHLNSKPWADDNSQRLLVKWNIEHADFFISHLSSEQELSTIQDDSIISHMLYEREFPSTTIHAKADFAASLFPLMQWPLGSRQTMYALQEWEGYVVEKREHEIVAQLVDLTALSYAQQAEAIQEEEATIPLSEISDNDIRHLQLGSVFRWVIGYERSAGGTKRRVSEIVFRNLPKMTQRDISEGKTWARKISQSISK